MTATFSRREVLGRAGVSVAAGLAMARVADRKAAGGEPAGREPFRYCLNTAAIMGYKLNALQEAEVTAQAGYSGIEVWIRKLREYIAAGRSVSDLGKRIADLGLVVEGAIGFSAWSVDDDQQRKAAMEELKADMELVAQVGGKRIAASPAGIHRTPGVDLRKVAERYRAVLELGRQTGVVAHLEFWGPAATLGRLSEAAYVAIQADHPDACLLLDVYQLYKGNSGLEGLKLLQGAAIHVVHMNDYPANPPRAEIADQHRVYPGDGIAPLGQVLRTLRDIGFRGALSLEIFNRQYWQQQEPLTVARTGLEKMRDAVRKALG